MSVAKGATKYTKLANVMGAGFSNPRLGDAIWPQLNMMYIIYCGEEDYAKIIAVVEKLREQYAGYKVVSEIRCVQDNRFSKA